MKGNTPKLIKKIIDDVEAAQADVRSGDPELMLHGFAALIAIVSDQKAMLTENYPEDRRMREFLDNQVLEMKKQHDAVAALVEKKRETDERHRRWRHEAGIREEDRKEREKLARDEQRRIRKMLAEIAAEERRVRLEKWAAEDARQPSLFPDKDGPSTTNQE